MSARDLVGRPLVPFFDADDNVNESLRLDTQAHEQLDVDARVWDKDLGYFVYPTNAPQATHSMPIPIKKETPVAANDGASGSFGKMLLTPDMLFSRSAPSASGSGMQQLHNTMGMTHAVPVLADTPGETTSRSASAKRGSRQKNRSSTPTRNGRTKQRNGNNNNNNNNANGTPTKRQQQQPQHTSDGGSSGGEDRTASDSSDKASRPAKNNNRKTRSKQQPQTPQKSADDLSSNGKWAWSAFQSSPDPRSLPLPPFVGGGGPSASGVAPPLKPPTVEERLDPPPPAAIAAARPPAVVAEGVPLPPPHPTSVEHSMTQDLRRMLNIGS